MNHEKSDHHPSLQPFSETQSPYTGSFTMTRKRSISRTILVSRRGKQKEQQKQSTVSNCSHGIRDTKRPSNSETKVCPRNGGRVKSTDEKDRWSGFIFFDRELSGKARRLGVWRSSKKYGREGQVVRMYFLQQRPK